MLLGQIEIADRPEAPASPPIAAYTYDGDTPRSSRPRIRKTAQIVISNPDMLHAGVLPHHTRWARFFQGLRFIVLDEIHTYRGLFGAHMSWILRRLIRVADHYGARPTFIMLSATVGNPGQLCSKLIGRNVEVVTENGAPSPASIAESSPDMENIFFLVFSQSPIFYRSISE